MAHSKQAQKRIKTDDLKRQRNKVTRTGMRCAIKRVRREDDAEKAEEALSAAYKKIDKAAKAGVIHANAAARRKSRLAKAAAAKRAS
jgi:small subunit ribosomal protein S20